MYKYGDATYTGDDTAFPALETLSPAHLSPSYTVTLLWGMNNHLAFLQSAAAGKKAEQKSSTEKLIGMKKAKEHKKEAKMRQAWILVLSSYSVLYLTTVICCSQCFLIIWCNIGILDNWIVYLTHD